MKSVALAILATLTAVTLGLALAAAVTFIQISPSKFFTICNEEELTCE